MVKHIATEFRIRFVEDPKARFEECDGSPNPLSEATYAEYQYMQDGQLISYAEYLNYYGNPERHVYLMSEVQRKCPCCKTWQSADGSLGWLDFMDDSPELQWMDSWLSPEDIELYRYSMLFLYSVASDGFDEAEQAEKR